MGRSDGVRREGGFSLVELVVVTMIFGVVTAAALGILDSMTRNQRRQEALVNNQERVRLALTDLTRDIRGADPVEPLASSAQYPYQVDVATRPAAADPRVWVRWTLTDTTLTRSTLQGPGGAVASTRTVLTNVRNRANGQPLLRYYDWSGREILTSARPYDFADCTVRVHISIESDSDAGPVPFIVNSDVQVRNHQPLTGSC